MSQTEVVVTLVNAFSLIVPEAVLVAAACLLFLGGTWIADRDLWARVALFALAVAGVALWNSPQWQATDPAIFASPIVLDRLGILIKAIALVGGAVLVFFSWNEVPDRTAAEYHACLLVIVAGLCLTGTANELVTLFLALELISIPTYVLLYLVRHDNAAREAAMKYFLLSVAASALLLFGFSYLYGLTGSTNLPAIVVALTEAGEGLPVLALAALVLIVAGLGFKITAVPFHFYAPDVYQGAPTVAAALLAFVPKVAGFVALMRVLGFVLPGTGPGNPGTGQALGHQTPMLFWIMAAVTMSLGNLMALLQDNLKRLLAYSSVAHAGYMLIGLAAATDLRATAEPAESGIDAVLFYLVAYGAMTVGAFAVLGYLSTPQRPVETVDDLAGLCKSQPVVALLMVLFLFSLIGMPLTAGFAGKFLLFMSAMMAPAGDYGYLFRWLALIGALNSAVGAYYYLRLIGVMYLRGTLKPLQPARSWPGLATLWVCAAVTLGVGVYPWPLLRATQDAVARQPKSAMTSTPSRGEPERVSTGKGSSLSPPARR